MVHWKPRNVHGVKTKDTVSSCGMKIGSYGWQCYDISKHEVEFFQQG